MTASGWPPPEPATPWWPLWAEWAFGGTVVGGESRDLGGIAFGAVSGRACVATATVGAVSLWDAATDEPVGARLKAGLLRHIALRDELLVAAGPYGVTTWDAATGRELWSSGDGNAGALATGSVDGRQVVALALGTSVRLLDALTGDELRTPLEVASRAIHLAVAGDRLVVAYESTVEIHGLSGREVELALGSARLISGLAALGGDGDLLVALAISTGRAEVWDVHRAKQIGESCQHIGITCVALAESGQGVLLATGGSDNRAVVRDVFALTDLGGSVHRAGDRFSCEMVRGGRALGRCRDGPW